MVWWVSGSYMHRLHEDVDFKLNVMDLSYSLLRHRHIHIQVLGLYDQHGATPSLTMLCVCVCERAGITYRVIMHA